MVKSLNFILVDLLALNSGLRFNFYLFIVIAKFALSLGLMHYKLFFFCQKLLPYKLIFLKYNLIFCFILV